jgi:hypothetical protein
MSLGFRRDTFAIENAILRQTTDMRNTLVGRLGHHRADSHDT